MVGLRGSDDEDLPEKRRPPSVDLESPRRFQARLKLNLHRDLDRSIGVGSSPRVLGPKEHHG